MSCLDREILDELATLNRPERPAFVADMVGVFLAGLPEIEDAIVTLAGAGQLESMRDRAHALAGTAANMGATELCEAARAIEMADDDLARECMHSLADALVQAAVRTRAAFEVYLGSTE